MLSAWYTDNNNKSKNINNLINIIKVILMPIIITNSVKTQIKKFKGQCLTPNKNINMSVFKSSENIQRKSVGQTDLFRIINPLQ